MKRRHVVRGVCSLGVIGTLLSLSSFVIGETTDRGADPPSDLPPRLYHTVHALCIGIDQYKSYGIPPLQFGEDDAEAVAEVFTGNYGYRVQKLIGHQATRENIQRALHEYANTLGEDDALIVFFAGHGATVELDGFGRAGFLVPFDAEVQLSETSDVEKWEQTTIGMRELGELVQQMKSRHVLLLIDACYSGFLGKRSTFGGRVDLPALVSRPSRMAITAGTEDQTAFEDAALEHGFYTHVLLNQLGNVWPTSATELFVSVRDGVARLTQGQMLPQLREIVVNNGEFVFLPKQIPQVEVESVMATATRRANERNARWTTLPQLYECFETLDYRYSVNAAESSREWTRRFKRFQENATLGDELAMAALHYCYARGLGTEPDVNLARQWAQRAHDSEHPAGKHVLGRCYLHGIGVDLNQKAGWELIRQAAAGADAFPISKFSLALQLSSETANPTGDDFLGTPDQMAQIKQWYQEAMQAGIRSAKMRYGLLQFVAAAAGDGQLGLSLLHEASDEGLEQATVFLAQLYLNGHPPVVPKDPAKSQRLWIQAAEAGHDVAQVNLIYYHMGYWASTLPDFTPSLTEAFRWGELAHLNGNAQGSLMMWECYANGKGGVPHDDAKAVEYLEIAVERKSPLAMHIKGTWVFTGRVFDKDPNKALTLFEQAARAGNIDSWKFAGETYEELARREPPGSAKTMYQLYALVRYIESVESGASNAAESQETLDWYDSHGVVSGHASTLTGPPTLSFGRRQHEQWKKTEFGKAPDQ